MITEAAWLLRNDVPAIKRLFRSIESGLFELMDLDRRAAGWIGEFMERYQNLGAQVADAALLYLAERDRIETIFTLDRRDFSVYRTSAGASLKIVPQT